VAAEHRLKEAVEQWRTHLSERFSLGEIVRLEQANGDAIATILAEALPILRARGGEAPDTAEDFAAYNAIVERERPRELMKDAAVLKRLHARVDRQLAEGGPEWDVFQNTAREYVLVRAEAMLLRERGWDPVALLIPGAPAIAIIASGTVVAVRDHMGGLHIHPYRRGTLNHLFADMRKAEEKVLALMENMKAPPPKNTRETLAPFATELWRLARKARIEGL